MLMQSVIFCEYGGMKSSDPFSRSGWFLWPFDYHGFDHVEYTEEEEPVESWLGCVFQGAFIYR